VAPPKVTNLNLEEVEKAVVVTYDLACGEPARVELVGSVDGGKTFGLKICAVAGDVGAEVQPGAGKKIVWQVRKDHPSGLDDKDVTLEVRATVASAGP
jgi:hypothetical protein